MTDKFTKTHPWRCRLTMSIPWDKADPSKGTIQTGERMARTKAAMQQFVDQVRSEHGLFAVTGVYKVS